MPAGMKYTFYTTDVFTDRIFGGNQLAVLPDARGLSLEQMQAIAAEFNYAESTFVLPPEDEGQTFRLRIFTPHHEMEFAGHPTVGSALVLAWIGKVPIEGTETEVVFSENVGPIPVRIEAEGGRAVRAELSARLPEFGPEPPPVGEIAALLGLAEADIVVGSEGQEDRPMAVSCGAPYLIVTVGSLAALERIEIDPSAWKRSFTGCWADAVYAICRETAPEEPGDFRARMFTPGIHDEDAATGSAAAALAGYLSRLTDLADGTERWVIHQGVEMGRPSRLDIALDMSGGALTAIRVAGRAVPVASGEIEVPDL